MYLVFALVAGIIGGALSIGIRMELQQPGLQGRDKLATNVLAAVSPAAFFAFRAWLSLARAALARPTDRRAEAARSLPEDASEKQPAPWPTA